MELKVVCNCGTKYKFDVEPVNGRMPWPVNCPTCGADGTELANDILRSNASTPLSVAPTPVHPKFNTLAFEWRTEHFADTYHFGVYENGERKFHSRMNVNLKKDAEETVTTEGQDWALAHGYKPGEDGFKSFSDVDADKITRRLGMTLWDEKSGEEVKGLLMKETL